METEDAVDISIPAKLIPVFDGPADVRWSCGGRGSAKTRSFAKMVAVRGYMHGNAGITGQLVCGRQFMNSLADSSLEECKRAIEEEPFLAAYYEVGDNYIKSHDGRIWFTFVGLDRNIASIKSKGRILVCWVDEAEPVTDEAWNTLDPTLREEGGEGEEAWNAELWVTWNPAKKTAPVERKFRLSKDPRIKGAVLNWRDNPKFPAVLERKRVRCLETEPDQYDHIWEGAYATAIAGAYYAKNLADAKTQGRIGRVSADPLFRKRVFCDLGGSGARADAFTMWVSQFVALQILVLNYYEAVGQPVSAHARWLESQGYTPDCTDIWLPHDGDTTSGPIDSSWKKEFEKLGYTVTIIPNQGKGAALLRVKEGRLRFDRCWFNADTTEAGRDALGWYHEKKDEARGIGLGPEHDWASHGADAFGLMCVAYEEPKAYEPLKYPKLSHA